jgi:hypothetical protein
MRPFPSAAHRDPAVPREVGVGTGELLDCVERKSLPIPGTECCRLIVPGITSR